jgi:hypothetical protein
VGELATALPGLRSLEPLLPDSSAGLKDGKASAYPENFPDLLRAALIYFYLREEGRSLRTLEVTKGGRVHKLELGYHKSVISLNLVRPTILVCVW